MSGSFNRLPQIIQRIRQGINQATDETAAAIVNEIKASMQEEKHGRTYGGEQAVSFTANGKAVSFTAHKGRKANRVHVASAPGEAPAVDTSGLISSIQWEHTGEFTAMVGTNQEQSAALEFGRIDGAIAPRPYMRPAANKLRPFYKDRVARLLESMR